MDRQEYLSFVANLIKKHYPPDSRRGLKASEVGLLIRRALPGTDWREFGFERLKDVLSTLETQNAVLTGWDDKRAYTVWLADDKPPVNQDIAPKPLAASRAAPVGESLKKDVWNAFVAGVPRGRRFMDRETGVLRMGFGDVPDAGGKWVEIKQLEQVEQRQWAVEFIDEKNVGDKSELTEALSASDWYRAFPRALEPINSEYVTAWNRYRSWRVIAVVKTWAEQNHVPREFIFDSTNGATAQRGRAAPIVSLRTALFTALAELSTDELLELRLPARSLVRVLQPELLSNGPQPRA